MQMGYKIKPIKSTTKFEEANPEMMKWMNEGYDIRIEYLQVWEPGSEKLKEPKVFKKALPIDEKGNLSTEIEWWINDGKEGIWRCGEVWCCSDKNIKRLKEAKFKEVDATGVGVVGKDANVNGGVGKDLLHYSRDNKKKVSKGYWYGPGGKESEVIMFNDDLGIRALGEISASGKQKEGIAGLMKGVKGVYYYYEF